MRLSKVRIQNYRSIIDSGWIDIEKNKTILVGSNEAGKTALLQAIQQINPPPDSPKFSPLSDYPRSKYNDITTKKVNPSEISVVEAHFLLEPDDIEDLPDGFDNCTYVFTRRLDNQAGYSIQGGPKIEKYSNITKDLTRLCAHIDPRVPQAQDGILPEKPSDKLAAITKTWADNTAIDGDNAVSLNLWLESILIYIDENCEAEENRYDKIKKIISISNNSKIALEVLFKRLPIFVYFNNYFRVKPRLHLEHLAKRIEENLLDDNQYDYGNQCLLRLLGFTARHLSNLGKTQEPALNNTEALKTYRDQLDERGYQLNSASIQLTDEICSVWSPNPSRDEANRLRIIADGQYLKVVVEDSIGVEIELDQRSEGFQWIVSFFVVFFAEALDKHKNAVLLLDEPGMSLHGLKQREFRNTISRLANKNQTIYTTHSPFLVGPDELDIVRVVEMLDRRIGTKVHTTIASGDPAAILPLQEALGYDLAQSLFTQQRNLVLEGLTDYWYIEAIVQLLSDAKITNLIDKIALVPAASAGKVVYYATILYAQKLKVAALLDSDSAGDQAAQQETLVHTLKNKGIIRTKDVYIGSVNRPEIEDLLRETLLKVAQSELGWDISNTANSQPSRPIIDIFSSEIMDFSKLKLAKAFLRWARNNEASNLLENEITQWKALVEKINKALK